MIKYNPIKYFYHRTLFNMKRPITWVVDLVILTVVFGVFINEGVLNMYEISIVVLTFYLGWVCLGLVLRIICSVLVCLSAPHHFGFNQEYYDCINGRRD